MKQPDIDAFKARLDKRTEQFVEHSVRPYCQKLLDKTQERLWRHRIRFVQGMGSEFVYVTAGPGNNLPARRLELRSHKLTDAPTHGDLHRLRARFPYLMELFAIAYRVEDELNGQLGDIEPTTTTTNP